MESSEHEQVMRKCDLVALTRLYNSTPLLTLTNISAATVLSLIAYSSVGLDLVLDWAGVFLGLILITLFAWTIYNRKYQAKEIRGTSSWVVYFTASNLVVSASFSAAYCYIILQPQTTLTPLIPFIALLFIVQYFCLTFLQSVNRIATTCFAVFGVAPVGIALALSSITNGLFYFIAIGIASAVSFLIATANNKQQLALIKRTMECEYMQRLNANTQKRMAQTTIEDSLTQIYNRRFYELMIDTEIRRARRANTSLSVAIIQIDCFDEYKELYGKTPADKCIRSVAQILSNATSRGGEFVSRFGESSFALLAPNVVKEEAVAFASKMQSLVAQAEIPHNATSNAYHKSVTISVGISELSVGSIVDVKGLIEQASIALKTANTMGTNNIQVFAQNVISTDQLFTKPADNANEATTHNNQTNLASVELFKSTSDIKTHA